MKYPKKNEKEKKLVCKMRRPLLKIVPAVLIKSFSKYWSLLNFVPSTPNSEDKM